MSDRVIEGVEFELTCESCPEQYDVLVAGERVGYVRVRSGRLAAWMPHPLDAIGDVDRAAPKGRARDLMWSLDDLFRDYGMRKIYSHTWGNETLLGIIPDEQQRSMLLGNVARLVLAQRAAGL